MGNFFSDIFGPPKEIDPDKVYSMMTSEYTGEMADRSKDLLDPNSSINQNWSNKIQENAQNNMYTANRMQRQNAGRFGGGQSGILNANLNATATKYSGEGADAFSNMMMNNLSQSNNLLSGAATNDMTARTGMADAYGQNITNRNNYNSAMGGMVMQGAGMVMMCDFRMKKDVHRIGKVKTRKGLVGMYKFKYKGRDKEHHGVMAQEVQKVVPEAVTKGKNGLLYVDYGKL